MTIGALPTPRVTFHNRGFRRGAGDTLQPEDTMADNDFVERLRIRWETMGDMANDERAAAADEIEFLRRSQRELMGQVATLREERDEQDEHNARMDHILTRTANALRGKPPENGLHSWHDLPELVEQLRKERDEARQRTNSILTEIDCRIEHGAESSGHLEVLRDMFKENTDE